MTVVSKALRGLSNRANGGLGEELANGMSHGQQPSTGRSPGDGVRRTGCRRWIILGQVAARRSAFFVTNRSLMLLVGSVKKSFRGWKSRLACWQSAQDAWIITIFQ